MDVVDPGDNVDIPTFTEQDLDKHQDGLVQQVQMVHERVCKICQQVS